MRTWIEFIFGPMDKPIPPPTMPIAEPCDHRWEKWDQHSANYQRRNCALCGITSERRIGEEVKPLPVPDNNPLAHHAKRIPECLIRPNYDADTRSDPITGI